MIFQLIVVSCLGLFATGAWLGYAFSNIKFYEVVLGVAAAILFTNAVLTLTQKAISNSSVPGTAAVTSMRYA